MNLKESEMFRNWFVNMLDNIHKSSSKENITDIKNKIGYDEGIIIDYNTGKRNEYIIKDLDCYNDYYREVVVPLIRQQKLNDLGI